MQENIVKVARILSYIAAGGILGVGVILMFSSQATDEQTLSTLIAIFGLLLVWFIAWTGRREI